MKDISIKFAKAILEADGYCFIVKDLTCIICPFEKQCDIFNSFKRIVTSTKDKKRFAKEFILNHIRESINE
jgi:hypothetical protein